jgi:hypothetical protein
MLHHALMRGLEGGEGWRRGGNCRRRSAVEMQRRWREVEGEGPDTRGQAVSDYKRVEGKNWTGRGRAGRASWAATLGRKKREEKGRVGKEREGGELEGFSKLFFNALFFLKPFQNLNTFPNPKNFFKISNKL